MAMDIQTGSRVKHLSFGWDQHYLLQCSAWASTEEGSTPCATQTIRWFIAYLIASVIFIFIKCLILVAAAGLKP